MQSERSWKLESVLLFTAGLVLCICLGMIGVALLHRLGPTLPAASERFLTFMISAVSFQGATLVLTHFLLRQHGWSWGEFLGYHLPGFLPAFASGAAAGALVVPGTYLLSEMSTIFLTYLQGPPDVQPTVQVLQLTVSLPQRIGFAITAVAVAPVCEEILFRGLLYGLFKQYGWRSLGLAVSSLFFGLIHGNPMTLLPLSALACVLCLLYDQTQNLMSPIAAHAVFNLFNFLTFFLWPKS